MKQVRNTEKSEKQVKEFLKNGPKLKRRVQVYEQKIAAGPEEVFSQLCPSRECDWIQGWSADLLYTTTGYAEADCIFRTTETSDFGPGLWVFTVFEPNKRLEIVRTIGDFAVVHLRISLSQNADNSTTGTWHLTYTALNEIGNSMVENLPDESPEFKAAITGLVQFLKD